MSVIIRLQNLPWAASANDIRRYFEGLKIPEGGVHIVGGELGDVFIAFSTDEDARQAMLRDGGKIHEIQIKLFLSSRSEMTNVIEKTRQQSQYLPLQQQPAMPIKHSLMHPAVPVQHQSNIPAIVSVQQPIVSHSQQSGITVATNVENDRKISSGSSLHRLTEKAPIRERNYSPDPRRDMRRDRSRSPIRRVGADVDRRNDRFGRDDRVYDENAQYRENRQLLKADSARHNNDDMNRRGVYRQTASHNYYESPTNDNLPINLKNIDWSNAAFALNNNREKQNSLSALNSSSANSFVQQSTREAYMSFTTESYEQMPSSNKEQMSNQVGEREKRQMRFNDQYPSTRGPAPFPRSSQVSSKIMDETAKDVSFNDKKFQDVSHLTGPKPSDEQPENSLWAKKRQGLLKPPVRKDSSWKNNQYGTPDQIKPGSGRYEEFLGEDLLFVMIITGKNLLLLLKSKECLLML
ncbi:hypothetical protein CEXT_552471 [Caerostris extrusa]|uniref:RRM domain-containing protein n=1 Tax=Caerostris extrusa TaxID=172846 RepID=A0AAV4N5Q1_CAEEX|nr:hypothetical protein CEXT_552471 [Caerostris extrusa]